MAAKKKKAEWVPFDKEEIEKLIAKLVKEGHSSAKAGVILRDQYGIPDVSQFGVKIGPIANKEQPREVPEDMFNLLSQAVNLHTHLGTNKKDSKARHSFDKMESKIRRLAKYYRKTKRLPAEWEYTIEKAKLLVK
jgi:small subunit ribosomal protein S15